MSDGLTQPPCAAKLLCLSTPIGWPGRPRSALLPASAPRLGRKAMGKATWRASVSAGAIIAALTAAEATPARAAGCDETTAAVARACLWQAEADRFPGAERLRQS